MNGKTAGMGLALFCTIGLMVTVSGCTGYGSPSGQPTMSPTPGQGGTGVAIRDFTFSPGNLAVPVGSTVTWTNEDTAPHQVFSDASGEMAAGGLFQSESLPRGATYSFTFTKAGTYPYHCNIHPTMKGIITVTG